MKYGLDGAVLKKHWKQYTDLTYFERKLLWQSVILLPIIHITLSILGYARLCGLIEKITPLKRSGPQKSESEIIEQARKTARMVSIAARYGLFRATCLRRSLLIWWFLRGQGIRSTICFGVRTTDRQLEAHAWVEINGLVISEWDGSYKGYQALGAELPPTRSGL